jgi:putative phage-type endonuclease
MKVLNVTQGSPEWLAIRATTYNASELSAAAGKSKYMTRDELLQQKKTGIAAEVDGAKQALFDRGHASEAAARPFAEEIIGEELSPTTGMIEIDGLKLLASFDGITFGDDFIFEHKLHSESLAAAVRAGELDEHYTMQMDQQLLISGASKCLFITSDGTKDKMEFCWYETTEEKKAAIVAIWKQFDKDLAEFQPVEVIQAVKAKVTIDFPAPTIEVGGAIALKSNLAVFGDKLKLFIADLPEKPSTDQEFADCKAAVTKLKDAEETLDAEESRALAQLTEIDAMRREKKLYFDLARETRLALDKLVKSREEMIKTEIVMKGKSDFAAYITDLNKQIGKPYMPDVPANFAEVIKNKRTIASLQGAVNDELARVKIIASEIAGKIQINLNSLRELAADHAFLFADTPQIVMKANDDLVTLIKMRIAEHKEAEEKRLEAEREKIRAEEEAKAKAAADEAARKAAAELAAKQVVEAAATQSEPALAEAAKQVSTIGIAAVKQTIQDDQVIVTNVIAEVIDTGATMKLGQISELLGFSVTANFLHTLGIESVDKERAAILYREADFPRICACLIANINAACVDFIEGQRKAA